MKHIIVLLFILSVTVSNTYAQIISKSTSPAPLKSGFKFVKEPKTFILTQDQKRELYRVDSLESLGDMPFRFGKDFSADIDIVQDGNYAQDGESTTLFYEIASPKAYSINLIFDRIRLVENVEMNIYNSNRSFNYGPITKENIPENNVLWTDLIRGDHVIIEVSQKGKVFSKENIIHISSVIHGYRNTFQQKKEDDPQPTVYGSAAGCNNDISCSVGNNWRQEADAVALTLLSNGTRWCTGSLLNNTLQNYTPYFLTAFHCLDTDNSGTLSATEQAAPNSWAFRFRYESPSCGGPDGVCYVTFNGSNFRSAYYQTDMTLLQLYNNTPVNYGISFLGWDKNQYNPSNGTLIHHPAGDVKKISFDNDPIFLYPNTINWAGGTSSPGGTHLNVGFDNGSFEGGSSGSPFFDQNHHVVGQLHGGQVRCAPTYGYVGSFFYSWGGGGTNSTRLSNWLDPNNSGLATTYTVYSKIAGPDLVCTTSTYQLENAGSGGSAILWSSSNTSVLTINGSGVATKVGNGTVTISADLTFCDGRTLHYSKVVSVGLPRVDYFLVNGQQFSNGYVCTNSNQYIQAMPFDANNSYTWSISSGNSSNASLNSSGNTANFQAYAASCFGISVNVHNACGNTQTGLSICGQNCFARYTVYPNPAQDYITVEFDEIDKGEVLPDEIDLYSENSSKPTKVINVQEEYKAGKMENGNKLVINVKDLPRGTYYLHIKNSRNQDKPVDQIRIVLE